MTYIKINDTLYPAAITGRLSDPNWGGRSSKTIRLEMAASTATELFINDVHWSIVEDYIDAEEHVQQIEYDNSEYCIAGDITDHRNGAVSVKMGKATDKEIIDIMMGGAV